MDAATGSRITSRQHLRQSVGKILTTAIGTRLRRRPFGSVGPSLVDAPSNPMALVQLYAAAATALAAWEPRLVVRRVSARILTDALGGLEITIEADELSDDGNLRPVTVNTSLGA
ncbi:baseplate assembly protein [Achromobacter sp. UMC71]|nr:baseplate assembly protein [Achromobacter sp. UMC71]